MALIAFERCYRHRQMTKNTIIMEQQRAETTTGVWQRKKEARSATLCAATRTKESSSYQERFSTQFAFVYRGNSRVEAERLFRKASQMFFLFNGSTPSIRFTVPKIIIIPACDLNWRIHFADVVRGWRDWIWMNKLWMLEFESFWVRRNLRKQPETIVRIFYHLLSAFYLVIRFA